jgi:hypothetical protein
MPPAKRPDIAPRPDRRLHPSGRFEAVLRWCERWWWLIEAYRAHRRGPALFDVARNAPTRQSSFFNPRLASRVGPPLKNMRFCATTIEDHPWWMVELKDDWPIHTIRIHNRADNSSLRAAKLVISVSPDRKEWQMVHSGLHHFGDQAAPGPLEIRLLGKYGGRHVRLELPDEGALCLRKVEVLVERKHRALRRACRRYGFTFPLATALRMNHPSMKSYEIETPPGDFDGTIQALHVGHRTGRFGNHLKQIVNALTVARRMGIRKVYLMPFDEFEVVEPIEADGVVLLPESRLKADRPGAVLMGSFFYPRQLGATLGVVRANEMAWAMDRFVTPLFRRKAKIAPFSPRDSDLAVHIRAGDVFSLPNPNAAYVQPPLAFYQLCITTARQKLGIDRVILVYENELNPCIPAIRRWLDQIGLSYVVQSGSLHDDLAVLLHARHCIFGLGSFGRAVALLSNHMATLFYPWLEPGYETIAEVRRLRAMRVTDSARGYMKRGQWRRSPEQIRMMMEYPIENLALTDSASAPRVAGPSADLRAAVPAR